MKAQQLDAPGVISSSPLVLRDIVSPSCGENSVFIRLRACGMCHTDLHVVEGELQPHRMPIIPGHQIVGVIQRVGARVTAHKIGDRVGVPWLHSTCGTCNYCLSGNENLCEHALFTGYDVDGGFAEFATAPADFVYSLPEIFDDASAAPLLCAGIIGYRALRLSNVNPGERLGLFGFGASAHITIQVARHLGCEVFVFSRSAHHRTHATHLGASWVGSAEETPPALLDCAISFAPVGELVPVALQKIKKGGTLALAGIYMSPIPPMPYELLYHERILRSVANSTRKDARDFLRIAAEIPVKTEIETYPLSNANVALQRLKEGKIKGAGVLIIE